MNNTDQQPRIVNHNEMHDCNVFMGDSYGGIFPLPGAQVTINQQLGPQKRNTSIEGKTEPIEQRQSRKEEAISAICKHLDFAPEMLGYDNLHQKLTNERIALLFRRCLGMSMTPPKEAFRPMMEQLWVLLIDERKQCTKVAGEPYFRQTVLNIFGYFAQEGLLTGSPLEIARAIFTDADTNTAKNISRGITSPVFPEELSDMLNFYISKLNNGEI